MVPPLYSAHACILWQLICCIFHIAFVCARLVQLLDQELDTHPFKPWVSSSDWTLTRGTGPYNQLHIDLNHILLSYATNRELILVAKAMYAFPPLDYKWIVTEMAQLELKIQTVLTSDLFIQLGTIQKSQNVPYKQDSCNIFPPPPTVMTDNNILWVFTCEINLSSLIFLIFT